MGDEILNQLAPPPALAAYFGNLIVTWGRLDGFASACLYAAIKKIDALEFMLAVGKLDTLAKLRRSASLLRHHGETKKAEIVSGAVKALDKIKGTRDTVAHAFYIGTMKDGTALFSNYTTTYSSGDAKGAELVMVTLEQIEAEINVVADQMLLIRSVFDTSKLTELLQLPAYAFVRDP